eukprot:GHRR01011043.1.p1 GENE.GHRR01011043.1~~GHRR01011043.1.p1  ORF type:complete len:471 (+),score=119.55 GHRR01011043.1:748-2160(+)
MLILFIKRLASTATLQASGPRSPALDDLYTAYKRDSKHACARAALLRFQLSRAHSEPLASFRCYSSIVHVHQVLSYHLCSLYPFSTAYLPCCCMQSFWPIPAAARPDSLARSVIYGHSTSDIRCRASHRHAGHRAASESIRVDLHGQISAHSEGRLQGTLTRDRAASLARALQLQPAQARAMIDEWPSLVNFSHERLAFKLVNMAGLLHVHPAHLSQGLLQKPKVLGYSLAEFEARVQQLQLLLGETMASQLVLREPSMLTWSPKHLQKRLHGMAMCLGLQRHQLLQLLQQHPQLLPASSHLKRSLQFIYQLLQLAKQAEEANFGSVKLSLQQTLQQPGVEQPMRSADGRAQQQQHLHHTNTCQMQEHQQRAQSQQCQMQQQPQQVHGQQYHYTQQQPPPGDALLRLAPDIISTPVTTFALEHVQLLLQHPEELLLQVSTFQAQSGLSAAQVAAVVVAQPHLLIPQHPQE